MLEGDAAWMTTSVSSAMAAPDGAAASSEAAVAPSTVELSDAHPPDEAEDGTPNNNNNNNNSNNVVEEEVPSSSSTEVAPTNGVTNADGAAAPAPTTDERAASDHNGPAAEATSAGFVGGEAPAVEAANDDAESASNDESASDAGSAAAQSRKAVDGSAPKRRGTACVASVAFLLGAMSAAAGVWFASAPPEPQGMLVAREEEPLDWPRLVARVENLEQRREAYDIAARLARLEALEAGWTRKTEAEQEAPAVVEEEVFDAARAAAEAAARLGASAWVDDPVAAEWRDEEPERNASREADIAAARALVHTADSWRARGVDDEALKDYARAARRDGASLVGAEARRKIGDILASRGDDGAAVDAMLDAASVAKRNGSSSFSAHVDRAVEVLLVPDGEGYPVDAARHRAGRALGILETRARDGRLGTHSPRAAARALRVLAALGDLTAARLVLAFDEDECEGFRLVATCVLARGDAGGATVIARTAAARGCSPPRAEALAGAWLDRGLALVGDNNSLPDSAAALSTAEFLGCCADSDDTALLRRARAYVAAALGDDEDYRPDLLDKNERVPRLEEAKVVAPNDVAVSSDVEWLQRVPPLPSSGAADDDPQSCEREVMRRAPPPRWLRRLPHADKQRTPPADMLPSAPEAVGAATTLVGMPPEPPPS